MQYKLMELQDMYNKDDDFIANLIGKSKKQYRKKKHGKVPFNQDEMFIIADFFQEKIDNIFLPRVRQNGAKS